MTEKRQGAPPGGAVVAAKDHDVVTMLRECIKESVGAVVSGQFGELRGTICYVTYETIQLELKGGLGNRELRPLEVCNVTFRHRAKAFVFPSSVRHLLSKPNQSRLALALPEAIIGVEGRSSFRVPILSSSQLLGKLFISATHRGWTVRIRDISLTGIRTLRPDRCDVELPEGTPVDIELRFDKELVRVAAVIRRSDRTSLGLFFTGVLRDGTLEPPETLRRLFQELQSEWLRASSRGYRAKPSR